MDDLIVRARRAAGETLHEIARDLGVSHVSVFRSQWGGRERPVLAETDDSFIKMMPATGVCSTDHSVVAVRLARSAANYD